jgi:hypothetical protein
VQICLRWTCHRFLSNRRLSGAIESIWVDLDFHASPHSAVVLRSRCSVSRELVQVLQRPRAFPLLRPVGCSLHPPCVDAQVIGKLRLASVEDLEPVNSTFTYSMYNAEEELGGPFDDLRTCAFVDQEFTGRGLAPDICWRGVVPRGCREDGRVGKIILVLIWAAVRFSELANLIAVKARGLPWCNARQLQ